jgi:probable rRNA maturation factor
MAKVHRDFLSIPGATDVITFPYGEILICAPVAAERAREFGHDTTTELALYTIHGLLHLSGHDDITPAKERRMTATQEEILAEVLRANR